jgi:sugar lactone lactonase YvrE
MRAFVQGATPRRFQNVRDTLRAGRYLGIGPAMQRGGSALEPAPARGIISRSPMKSRYLQSIALLAVPLAFAACNGGSRDVEAVAAPLPVWAYDSTMIFPADQSLSRPEDGVALPDGRVIVADQLHGLRMIEVDGTSMAFGDLPGAGYSHRPPEHSGGANGVSLEPDATHLLVSDIYGGAIYRVEIATGATEKVYQHTYGINAVIRDSQGAIWFTQSTQNSPEAGEGRMWASLDRPVADGALLRLPWVDGAFADAAEVVVDSLYFANGVAIDEAGGHLYVAEIIAARVLRFRVDVASGRVSERTVFMDGVWADNLKLDGAGRLWTVSPFTSELLVVNTATGERHTAFSAFTPEQEAMIAEFTRRGESGAPRLDLITPAVWAPLPGFVTGVILAPGDRGTVYLTGLGGALLRLPQ